MDATTSVEELEISLGTQRFFADLGVSTIGDLIAKNTFRAPVANGREIMEVFGQCYEREGYGPAFDEPREDGDSLVITILGELRSRMPDLRRTIATLSCVGEVDFTAGKPLPADVIDALAARTTSKVSESYRTFLSEVGAVRVKLTFGKAKETLTLGVPDPGSVASGLLPILFSSNDILEYWALDKQGHVVRVRSDGTTAREQPEDFELWVRRDFAARYKQAMFGD